MHPAIEHALEEADQKRDRRFSDRPASPIKRIWQQHHEVIRLAVLGFGTIEIAKMVGFTPLMVRNILGSEVVKRQIEVMTGAKDHDCLEVRKDIDRLAPTALGILRDIMENPEENSRVRVTAAIDILDRAGLAAPKVIHGDFSVAHLTSSDLEEIKQRAREANIIDVTPCSNSEQG